MSEKIPSETFEKKDALDDNARKFIVDGIDRGFLDQHESTSFDLTVDWLETGEDNERKLAYKAFATGDVQILLISKVTKDGKRTAVKDKLTERTYAELLDSSVLHLEKTRFEFEYIQNGTPFSMKYDEFTGGELYLLEVDAPSDEERAAFDPKDFQVSLREVTGDLNYYGYRIANMV